MGDAAAALEGIENAGIQPQFIPTVTVITALAITGIFCNTNVALTVVTSKKLRSVSNYLIAANAIGDIGHQMSHLFVLYSIFSGQNVTSTTTCFAQMAIPFFFMDFTLCIMIWLALDRILVIACGNHENINKKIYLPIILSTSSIYGLVLLYFAYQSTIAVPNAKVICVVISIFNGDSRKIWLYSQSVVCAICVVMYAVFWILLKSKHGSKLNDATTKLVARSVTTIVVFVLLCWVLTTLALSVIVAYFSTMEFFRVLPYIGIIYNISMSCNFFVLYFLSSEYKRTLRMQLSWIFPCYPDKMETQNVEGIAETTLLDLFMPSSDSSCNKVAHKLAQISNPEREVARVK
ncbi:serpentine type 7TM GPCR chemoreceptor srsx domain-containing protein [Ditylenchus destructor]|nr:serpentine type 7TM GPCR chemoreceptor srsx domain-containing protein [Ditylenchus destructor]